METTLLLNASFEPLKIITWQRAITLLFAGKVEVIEEYTREIHSVTFSIRLPSIIRLLKYVRVRRTRVVKFSRANIYARDRHTCQYCGQTLPSDDLTFDHVIPVSRGGTKSWENIVTACIECNRKKGGRTPEEAGMKLVQKPHEPLWVPSFNVTFVFKNFPESWRDYLYWNVELET
ncbi:MAG TPA: HNH endonuclease [Terriglobia bacterium]|nr:HNH endonuclease [Terriglobia bacterium]